MSKIMILMPNGYEEIEALTVVDFCRRADIEIDMVSITGELETIGDHNIKIITDKKVDNVDLDSYDGVVLPGGYPGTMMLKSNKDVLNILEKFFLEKKLVASICASPLVLEEAEIASKIEGTIYPGMEDMVKYKKHIQESVVLYENVITSRGPATATLFAYKIIEYLRGKEVADKIKQETLSNYIEK
ncbi:DJ-1 family glyoxalase III [Peptostreptococcus faecalis]|uniref:DJ-1 family glyoxalase III n=1 Tax=Peptostreptococcus faecalis TaxID=2045015 RepID=UPI000C7C4875|nr:DJ-1 family glyoxalase III [Peptostreptococcus faecalis]